jgi:hypothetical protein
MDKYRMDPITGTATGSGALNGLKLTRWLQLVNKYKDRTVRIHNRITDRIEELPITNPYRASAYRQQMIDAPAGSATFQNPAGNPPAVVVGPSGEHPERETMWRQNAVILNKIAPPEILTDNRMSVAILESLWFCGSSIDLASDPRCFPARALGELREFQETNTQEKRAALARRALQNSQGIWKQLKGSLKRLTGSDTALTSAEAEAAAALAAATASAARAAAGAAPPTPDAAAALQALFELRIQQLQSQIAALRHEIEMRSVAPPPPPPAPAPQPQPQPQPQPLPPPPSGGAGASGAGAGGPLPSGSSMPPKPPRRLLTGLGPTTIIVDPLMAAGRRRRGAAGGI